jgi:hypothetical protein
VEVVENSRHLSKPGIEPEHPVVHILISVVFYTLLFVPVTCENARNLPH